MHLERYILSYLIVMFTVTLTIFFNHYPFLWTMIAPLILFGMWNKGIKKIKKKTPKRILYGYLILTMMILGYLIGYTTGIINRVRKKDLRICLKEKERKTFG